MLDRSQLLNSRCAIGLSQCDGARDKAPIDFSGFEFGDYADFSDCKWRYAKSGKITSRSFAPGRAFGPALSFDGVVFGSWAWFRGAAFGDGANFGNAIYKGDACFSGESKEQRVRNIESLRVKDEEELWWSMIERGQQQLFQVDSATLKKRHQDSWESNNSGPDRFLTISFAGTRFYGEADFSHRSFERTADFTSANFHYPPDFDAAVNVAQIDFTGAHIGFVRSGRPHWTFQSRVPIRLRALRKIAEDTKNHDLERDLYIEERKAERGVYLVQRFEDWVKDPKRKWALLAHLLWIGVMGFYWLLADYGRSFARPFLWLIASGFIFYYWGYPEVLAPLMPQAGTPDAAKYEHAVGMLALGNAVPFVGPLTIDAEIKKLLFCPRGNCLGPLISPGGYQMLVLGQNLLSIILVFFIGLALRNYFKIK